MTRFASAPTQFFFTKAGNWGSAGPYSPWGAEFSSPQLQFGQATPVWAAEPSLPLMDWVVSRGWNLRCSLWLRSLFLLRPPLTSAFPLSPSLPLRFSLHSPFWVLGKHRIKPSGPNPQSGTEWDSVPSRRFASSRSGAEYRSMPNWAECSQAPWVSCGPMDYTSHDRINAYAVFLPYWKE